ncbi:MAG TPA: hypothetical protein HA284_00545 [Nanoarchaeota archaeon]|nr:MAG: hypothetical protein QJ16_C0012G0010 [archaeon GW2011_AR1]HIH52009.1 hypothetical protein [Nanoarchaeota archaeon]
MDKGKIASVKESINSIERNLEKLKLVMKSGDDEEFKKLKNDSVNLTKKIESESSS